MFKSLKGHPIPRSFPSFHDIQASFISTSHSSIINNCTTLYTHCYLLLFYTVVWACICDWMAPTWNIPSLIAMCCLLGPLHRYCYRWGGKGKLTQGATLLGKFKPLSLFADREGLCYPSYASFPVVNFPGKICGFPDPFRGCSPLTMSDLHHRIFPMAKFGNDCCPILTHFWFTCSVIDARVFLLTVIAYTETSRTRRLWNAIEWKNTISLLTEWVES